METLISNIGIIGTGWIADKMAITLSGMKTARLYAIASRSYQKAEQFAKQYSVPKIYGSYQELADDENIDLIYIATPHSHHYQHAKMCLLKGKPVLCEKAFTVNAGQAQELIKISQEKKVFLAEAIWTRYQPMRKMISDEISSNIIGKPLMISANLCYPNIARERMFKPELAGGALLDLGVYVLNFADMFFGYDIKNISSDGGGAYTIDPENGLAYILSINGDNKNVRIVDGMKMVPHQSTKNSCNYKNKGV